MKFHDSTEQRPLDPESSEAASSDVTDDEVDSGRPPDLVGWCSERPCCNCACRLEKVLPNSGRCWKKLTT